MRYMKNAAKTNKHISEASAARRCHEIKSPPIQSLPPKQSLPLVEKLYWKTFSDVKVYYMFVLNNLAM